MLNYMQSVDVMDGTERPLGSERTSSARLEGQPGQSKAVPRGASARAGVAKVSVYPAQAEALRMMIEQA